MGLRKTIFSLSIKRVAALASVLGAVGGIAVATASAQNARAQFESLNQSIRQATHGRDFILEPENLPQENVARLASTAFSPQQAQNSVRIIRSQRGYLPPARQQATGNRRALVGRGRMVSAGFRQEPGVLGSLPPKPTRTVLQKQDEDDFFGGDQAVPTIPRNDTAIPAPKSPNSQKLQDDGALPDNIFQDPFDKERQPEPKNNTVEIPSQLLTEPEDEEPRREEPRDELPKPQQNRDDMPQGSNRRENPNPFVPQNKDENQDSRIDYQPGRGLNTTRSRSNVYRPPGSDRNLQPNNACLLYTSPSPRDRG